MSIMPCRCPCCVEKRGYGISHPFSTTGYMGPDAIVGVSPRVLKDKDDRIASLTSENERLRALMTELEKQADMFQREWVPGWVLDRAHLRVGELEAVVKQARGIPMEGGGVPWIRLRDALSALDAKEKDDG